MLNKVIHLIKSDRNRKIFVSLYEIVLLCLARRSMLYYDLRFIDETAKNSEKHYQPLK